MTNLETITGKDWNTNINDGYEGTFNVEVSKVVDIEVNVCSATIYVSTYKNANSFECTKKMYCTIGEGQVGQQNKLNEILNELLWLII